MPPRAPTFVPSFDMPTVPASGLLSPSPSISELDKAAQSSKSSNGRKEMESSVDVNGLKAEKEGDCPLQSIKDIEAAVAVKEPDPNDVKPGIVLQDAGVAGKIKKKKTRKIRAPSQSRSLSRSRSRSLADGDIGSDSYPSDSDSVVYAFGSPARRGRFIKEYGAYMKSLEERITELEKGKPPRSRRASNASSVISIVPDVAKIAIPKLKLMTWEEYLKDKGKPIPEVFHAIDVLIDEPILYHQRTRKKHSHEEATSGQANEMPSSAARRSEGLPSRIRINSDMILQHLWRLSKKRFAAGKPMYPRTILRPFKVLYLFENEIRELLAELEAKVNAKTQPPAERKSTMLDKDSKSEAAVTSQTPDNAQTPQGDLKEEADTPPKEDKADNSLKANLVSGNKPSEGPAPEVIMIPEEEPIKITEEQDEGKTGEKTEEKIEEKTEEEAKTFDERLESEEAVNDLRCLIDFIDSYLKKVQGEFDRCERQKVRFPELWHLLKPDQLLYVNEKNCPQHIWRAVQVTGGRPYLSPFVPQLSAPPDARAPVPAGPPAPSEPKLNPIPAGYDTVSPFVLDCEYIDYSGVRFGPIFRKFFIDPFDDEMDIKDLSVVPYAYAKKVGLVNEEELRKRGEKFLEFTEPQHRYYSGKTLIRTPWGTPLVQTPEDGYYRPGPSIPVSEETVESEVMVDFDRTFNSNPKWMPPLGVDIVFEMMDSRECREPEYEDNSEDIDYDVKWDQQIRNDIMALINLQSSKYFSKEDVPTGNDLLLLPSRVYAFILRSRKWGKFKIAASELYPLMACTCSFSGYRLYKGNKGPQKRL
jgi:hypothetical protein